MPSSRPGFYLAAGGGRIDLPQRSAPAGEIPRFRAADLPWIPRAVEQAEAELHRYRKDVEAGANPVYAARLAPAEAARREARARFGAEGAGFLVELNAGRLWGDFWRAMFCLCGLRAERPVRIEGETQTRILSILGPLPPDLRRRLLAQAFFPSMRKPRQFEGLHALVIEELRRPWADLRDWECGAEKLSRPEDLDDATLIEIARSFGRRVGHFSAFLDHVRDTDPSKPGFRPPTGEAPGERPVDRAEALAMLEDRPAARTYRPGRLVQSEINLAITQAFHTAMRARRPGIPGGHLMQLALSTKPAGPNWPDVAFAAFPPEVVWPYIASHLDVIGRALTGDRLPWEPKLEPLKALNVLMLLPELPADVVASVEEQARSGTAACRTAARTLLAGL